jgi:Zn finger protein HypA/HybF involved in hydrogenase expression
VRFHCRDCGADFSLDIRKDDKMVCKSCGGSNYKMTAGREFYISSIEGE